MKMLNLSMASVLTVAILFTGCSTSTPKVNAGNNPVTGEKFLVDNTLPGWYDNEQQGIESGIAAVGQARYSKYGYEVMMPEAMTVAKENLAAKIEEKVWGFHKTAAKRAKIDLDDAYAKMMKDAVKHIVKGMRLSGVVRISRYQSPVDGTLYVRIMIPFNTFKNDFKASQNELKKKYKAMGLTTQAAEAMVEGVDDESEREWAH